MKYLKILSKCLLLLIVFFKILSCDSIDRRVDFAFSSDVKIPEKTILNKATEFKIIITSSVYNNGYLKHYVNYVGNRGSFLVSAKGDTIDIGESFVIDNLDEWVCYKFYGKDLGEHNLKFTFTNSMGKEFFIERTIFVEN